MASGEILYIDGFDHYGQDQLPYRWDYFNNTYTGWTISTSTKRTGRGSFRLNTNGNNYPLKNIPTARNATVGLAVYGDALSGSSDNLINFYNASGRQCGVRIAADGTVEFWRGGDDIEGTKLKESNSGEITAGAWYYLEVAVHTHQSAGTYEVHKNGTVLFSGEGDTCYQSATDITGVGLHTIGTYTYVDDLYILSGEEFLGDMEVVTCYPNGAGNYSEWTPSGESLNYQCVDEEPYSGTDYVVCSGENLIDTYTFGDISEYSEDNIQAVQTVTGNYKTGSGTEAIQHVIRTGAADYSGESNFFPGGLKFRYTMWQNNPGDDQPWERGDVNSAEFGMKRIIPS